MKCFTLTQNGGRTGGGDVMFGFADMLIKYSHNEGRLSGSEEPTVLTQHEHCPDTIRSSFLLTQ